MKSTETVRILNRGKSFEYSKWETLTQYTNDCFKQDFVSYENCILACVKSHLSESNNEPHLLYENQENKYLVTGVDSEYWELVIPYTPGVIYIPNYNEETGELTWRISNEPEDVPSTLIDNFVWRKPEGLTSASLGKDNVIEGNCSMIAGEGLETKNDGEVAFGKYNKSVSNTKFTIGIGNSDTDRKNAYEIMQDGKQYIYGIGGYDGTNPTESEDLAIAIKNLIEITYTELVNLRNNAKLISGRLYRITDYITTTAELNTQSAEHPFDVIVLALSESELSEQAWAVQSARDTNNYFANSKLSAWKIWYCLDNDTSRFAWADTENGKGVIYRMIDEANNDCPYDFKNIQFKHSDELYYFTFTCDTNWDSSVRDKKSCRQNIIKPYISAGKQYLNRNIFLNRAGDGCVGNILEENCNYNTFKTNCSNNLLNTGSRRNSFGNGCQNNTISGSNNTFGNNCYGNVMEGMSNSTFGNSCYGNRIGNNCDNIVLTANCTYNYFGESCTNITLGTFFRYMRFENFVDRISFINNEDASKNMQVQAYVIDSNINQSGVRLNLNVTRALNYTTQVAKDSSGNIKQFCIADIIA